MITCSDLVYIELNKKSKLHIIIEQRFAVYSLFLNCICISNSSLYFLHLNGFFPLCVCTSQLRAQNQVLKKGVVDEQANSASLKVQ